MPGQHENPLRRVFLRVLEGPVGGGLRVQRGRVKQGHTGIVVRHQQSDLGAPEDDLLARHAATFSLRALWRRNPRHFVNTLSQK